MTTLTPAQVECLRYLNGLMEATANMVGRYVRMKDLGFGGYSACGAGILSSLRKRKLVAYLPDLKAWRITRVGRAILEALEK